MRIAVEKQARRAHGPVNRYLDWVASVAFLQVETTLNLAGGARAAQKAADSEDQGCSEG